MSKKTPIKPYKLKNGDTRYMFRISLGTDPLTGKQKNTTRRSFRTIGQAQLAYDRLKYELHNGTLKKQQFNTYQDVYEEWINDYKGNVEKSTFDKTTGLFKNHILPAMGDYRVEKINYQLCKKHVNEWMEKLVRFNMVKFYASKVMDEAIKLNLIETNPFKLVETPNKRIKNKMEIYFTREQLIDFLNCTENEGDFKKYIFFRLLGFAGIRKSEAFALTWEDINFVDNSININKAIGYSKDNGLYVKSTKTGETRIIKMDSKTMDILKTWQEKQFEKLQLLSFNVNQPKQLVFQNAENKHFQPSRTWGWLNKILTEYNLKYMTTHGLRHTHATLLAEAGASLPSIQQRLGHSGKDTTTKTYIHVTEKMKTDTLDMFIEYMDY
ncbi:tyrosine-type recombinase/integrase [Psychrobacillus sp. NPDC096389]|uniref:tyrosine-type recombinase/integrase n=1 Tax=Psychrobacillus sp. NPDC096389 TaxID=3364490 RepID=UPI0037FC8248